MFSNFFNYDNSVWSFIGKFWDVLILNILWIICCIPIVTVGASTTALYYHTIKMVRDEDSHLFRSFFKSFWINLKQSSVIWCILLVVGVIIGVDFYFFGFSGAVTGPLRYLLMYVFGVAAVLYLIVFIYIFPLQSRFYNSVKGTFRNALFMAIRHFPQTLVMVAGDGIVVFLMITYLPWLIFWFAGLIAFFNSYFLNRIFEKYIPEPGDGGVKREALFEDEARR